MQQEPVTNLVIAGGSRLDLFECLLSLAETRYKPSLILVLDNSAAGLKDDICAAFDFVEVLRPGMPVSFATAANIGIRHAISSGAGRVFLLNDDVTVHPETLSLLVEAERETGPGLYAPQIWPYRHREPRMRYRFDWRKRLLVREPARQTGEPTALDYAEASAVLISAEAFESIGGFDEDFGFYFEDADFSVRVKEAGFPVIEVPGARVWHKVSASAGKGLSPFKAYYRARNTLKFALKHRRLSSPARNVLYHVAGFLAPQVLRALAKTAVGSRRDRRVLAALVRGTWDFCTGNGRPLRRAPLPEPSGDNILALLGENA